MRLENRGIQNFNTISSFIKIVEKSIFHNSFHPRKFTSFDVFKHSTTTG
jgi:hypothetical protein